MCMLEIEKGLFPSTFPADFQQDFGGLSSYYVQKTGDLTFCNVRLGSFFCKKFGFLEGILYICISLIAGDASLSRFRTMLGFDKNYASNWVKQCLDFS